MKTLIIVVASSLVLVACSQEAATTNAVAVATTAYTVGEKLHILQQERGNASFRTNVAAYLLPDPRCDRYRNEIAATKAPPGVSVSPQVTIIYEAAKRDNCRKPM